MANKTKNRLREKYSQVDNSIPRNYNLSYAAIGFYTLINSLPDGWEFTIKGIMALRANPNAKRQRVGEGEQAIRSMIRELTLEGALVRVRASFHNDTVGGYGGFDWIINPDAEDIERAGLEDPILTRLTEEIEIKSVKVGGDISNYNKKTIIKNPQPPKQSTEQKEKPKDKLTQFRDLIMDNMKEMKILSIGKSKVNNTDDTKANFKAISNEAIFNMEQLAKEYAEYVNRNRGKAVRLDKWLLAYMERNLNDIEYVKDFSNTSSTQPQTSTSSTEEQKIKAYYLSNGATEKQLQGLSAGLKLLENSPHKRECIYSYIEELKLETYAFSFLRYAKECGLERESITKTVSIMGTATYSINGVQDDKEHRYNMTVAKEFEEPYIYTYAPKKGSR